MNVLLIKVESAPTDSSKNIGLKISETVVYSIPMYFG